MARKELEVASGSTLLNTLSVNGMFLSSACGGKGSCGQCKCQVVEGAVRFCLLKYLTSAVSKYRITGVWVAR